MKRSLLAAILMVLFLLHAAGSVWAETLELLTWKWYAPAQLIEKFEKETGITVKPTYSNSDEMIAKLTATRGAGFDLAQPSQDRISSVQQKYQIFQPIDYSRVKTDQIVPSMLAAVQKNTMVNGKSYAVPHVYGTHGLIVNKKYASDADDYAALLDPKYKGRVSYRLKRSTLIGLALSMGDDPFALYGKPEAYDALMEKIGRRLIEAKPLVKLYYTNGEALLEAMSRGEVYLAMAWDNGGWRLHEEDPHIDFVVPASGALGWIDTFAIPAGAKNIEAAYKWINFMLRPENAAVLTNQEKYATASRGAIEFYEPAVKANFERSFSQADIDNIKWYPPVPPGLEEFEAGILKKVRDAQ